MTGIVVRPARLDDRERLARLRCALYTDCGFEESLSEVDAAMTGARLGGLPWAYVVAEDAQAGLVGFAEMSLRSHANGCDPARPVGYLEGWWVDSAHRRRGIGRALVDAAIAWARGHGCTEFASDAHADNTDSHLAHAAVGFEQTDVVVTFRRPI